MINHQIRQKEKILNAIFVFSVRSDLVFHVQKEHLSIDSDDDENHNIQCDFCDFSATEKCQMDEHVKAKHVLSSNVEEEISEITIDKQKIDPLGVSPVKEKTLEQLMFQEPELQVNLFQKHLFLQQLTHNVTKDCLLVYQFST